MSTKKKPTEEQLKNQLWELVKELDFAEGEDLSNLSWNNKKYAKWADAMTQMTFEPHKVEGFTASKTDLRKITDEVKNSCLTDVCKKSLLSALKNAKKVK